jgi:heavy metal translocating P-type ATPase
MAGIAGPSEDGFAAERVVALVALASGGLALGLAVQLFDYPQFARWIWAAAIVPILAVLCIEIVTNIRRGNVGLDIIAALAMAGALLLGETLAGVIVGLMYSGGQLLEKFARGRARREMTALLSRVPRVAIRHIQGTLEEVQIDAIVPGDRVLVRTGEAVPADGTVATGSALLDQSTLTGESIPVQRRAGHRVLSGSINLGPAFDLLVTRAPAESTYAGIVRLVAAAQSVKAPMVRLADRYGLWFLAATVALTTATAIASGDPIRALAVLVVATPCPLILAVPVAIMSGVSRAARIGVLVKGGAALEALADTTTIVIDKTGTLTEGKARLVAIDPVGSMAPNEILRFAATLDLASNHVVAAAIVAAAEREGLPLGRPTQVQETPGVGIEGMVEGRRVAVGGVNYIAQHVNTGVVAPLKAPRPPGAFAVTVAIDGAVAGHLILADEIRGDVADAIRRFRDAGVTKIILASGDREDITRTVATRLGLDESRALLSPQEKVETVLRERQSGRVMMVGDGVNDAPALAAADVGVALGVRGAAASAEVADVVLLVDRIDLLADAVMIARRSRQIALQSATAGLVLSMSAMVVAGLGYLPPVQGALFQEVIDVAVVLNALRALGGSNQPAG